MTQILFGVANGKLWTENDPIEKPASRWVNRWIVMRAHATGCTVCGAVASFAAGEIVQTHCRTYPSRDVAETMAREVLDDATRSGVGWLGAFPVEPCNHPNP